jgi:hypothetical protein
LRPRGGEAFVERVPSSAPVIARERQSSTHEHRVERRACPPASLRSTGSSACADDDGWGVMTAAGCRRWAWIIRRPCRARRRAGAADRQGPWSVQHEVASTTALPRSSARQSALAGRAESSPGKRAAALLRTALQPRHSAHDHHTIFARCDVVVPGDVSRRCAGDSACALERNLESVTTSREMIFVGSKKIGNRWPHFGNRRDAACP